LISSPEDKEKAGSILDAIAAAEYYSENSVSELVSLLQCEGVEDDLEVYKVTFTKVGDVAKSKVTFSKVG
jgi:hypothetical protein